MKLSSIVGIALTANDYTKLSQFLRAFEKNMPVGCAVLIMLSENNTADTDNDLLAALYSATTLSVEIAHHNTPLEAGKVYAILRSENFILHHLTFQLASVTEENSTTTSNFWQSLATTGINGIAALAMSAEPYMVQHIHTVSEAGGITVLCQPDETNLSNDQITHLRTFFNYIQSPTDLAHTVANFLQLFTLPEKQNNETDSINHSLDNEGFKERREQNLSSSTTTPTDERAITLTYTSNPILPELSPPIPTDLTNLLQTTQTAILFFDHQLELQQFNSLALQYSNLAQTELSKMSFRMMLPDVVEDARRVLKNAETIEYYVPDESGRPTIVKIFVRTGVNPWGLGISFTPVILFEHLQHRFQLLADELESQGLEHIRTIIKLRHEVEINETQRQLLESVLSNMGEGVLATNEVGQVILLNEVAKQIIGLTQPNTHLQEWVEQQYHFYPTTDSTAVLHLQHPIERAIQGNAIVAEEWLVVNKQTTEERYWQIQSRPYKNTKTVPGSGAVMVISDITHRKKSEIALKNSEQTQKALLDAIPDLLFRVNQEGVYLDYIPEKTSNPIPAAAFIGNKITDLMPKEVAGEIMEQLQLSLQTLQVQTYPFDYVGNVIKFYEARFSPINHQEALGIVRDVTDMIVGKDALKRGTRHYQKLISISSFPIIICNRKGEIISANPATTQLLEANNASELQGKFIEDFVSRKQRHIIREAIKNGFVEALSLGTSALTLITQNDKEVEVAVSGSVITYDNQLAAQIVLQDISPKLKWENQYHLLADTISDALVWIDPNKLLITNCNTAFLTLLNCKHKKEVVKKKWIRFSPSHQADGNLSSAQLPLLIHQALNNEQERKFLWRFENMEGLPMDVKVTLQPFTATDAGNWLAVIQPCLAGK